MPTDNIPLCGLYIPALDRRRIDAVRTPFIFEMLARYPSTQIRTQPSTELVPTMISGVWPHQHGIWQVSLQKSIGASRLDRTADQLPDIVTTTLQCFRHLVQPEYDLPAIPYWRRRRLKLHRFKYNRRQTGAWRNAMMEFAGYPTIFAITAPQSRYRFALDYDAFETYLSKVPGKDLRLDFIEFYGLDFFSHWNLDRPSVISDHLKRIDQMVEKVFHRCRDAGFRMLLLVDHGQEEVHSTINIFKALKSAGVSKDEFTYFIEVACARLWFHSDNARERIMSSLGSIENLTVFTSREMHRFDVCFDHSEYGEVYIITDPGFIFFPHDFYHPLGNIFMGLRRRALRPRITNPRHRGYHGHQPDHPAEEGFMIIGDDSFTARKDLISLIDVAPTILDLIGIKNPTHMKGQPAFGPQEKPQIR